jgi:hypothetical protein
MLPHWGRGKRPMSFGRYDTKKMKRKINLKEKGKEINEQGDVECKRVKQMQNGQKKL